MSAALQQRGSNHALGRQLEFLLFHELRDRLWYLRKKKNLSLEQLAERSGLSTATLSYFESGKRTRITEENLRRWSKALAIDYEILTDQLDLSVHLAHRTCRRFGQLPRGQLSFYIQERRRSLGLTQKQLAEQCRVSTKTISLYEKGRQQPSFDTLLLLAKALQCNAKDLLSMEPN